MTISLFLVLALFLPTQFILAGAIPIGFLAMINDTAAPVVPINLALASNGAEASGSSTITLSIHSPSGAINGDRSGANWGVSGGWNDSTAGVYPDYFQITFPTLVSLTEVDVFTVQDTYAAPANPTAGMTFSQYGLSDFKVQYDLNGVWTDIPGASVSGNILVWRQFTFSAVTTGKIRIVITSSINSYSRITEVEAWGVSAGSLPAETRTNVALASNGATATASSTNPSYSLLPAYTINGDRRGLNWTVNGGWEDNDPGVYPDWVQVDFSGSKTINEIDVFFIQDNYASPQLPIDTMITTMYGVTAFQVQYWDGAAWQDVTGGNVTGNTLVWRQFTFSSITTSKIRIYITGTQDGHSRIAEVEAWAP